MPIFDNELIDNVSDRTPEKQNIDLRSIDIPEVNTNPVSRLGGFETYGQTPAKRGLTVDEISEMSRHAKPFKGFGAPFESVSQSELLSNKRYPMYSRNVDLENVYGLQQSAMSQLGNGFAKLGVSAVSSFGQSFFTIPDTISAVRNLDMSKLSGDMDGGEAKLDDWQKNMEDRFPNFMTRNEKEHPFLAAIPGFAGSANFWGDKVIKNIGFTAGTIAGSLVQDAAIGFVTSGLGAVPLVGAQIGRAALAINKLFAGTSKLDEVLDLAKGLGKTEQQLFNIQKLGQIAAATKLTKSAQYVYSLYGASRTEAAIEAREGFREVKEELTRQYKQKHYDQEPTAEALAEIENYATNAMNVRFGTNLALLTVSNAVQFDNIFRTFNLGNKEIGSSVGKIGLQKGSLDVFEKKTAETLAGKVWDTVKPTLKNVLAEGVYEEGGQYAAQKGTYDYYTRKYKNLNNPDNKESWDWLNESIDSTGKGLAEQFGSQEGIESMLVGAISALITGGITNKVQKIRGVDEDTKLKSSINILNRWGLTDILENQYGDALSSVNIAKEMKQATESGNVFKFKNLKRDLFYNYVKSRSVNGLHDVTIDQLNMLKDLDKDQFEKMFGVDLNKTNKATVSSYVDGMIEKANHINATIESVNTTFTNPFKFIVDPKNPEEDLISKNYNTFEDWKNNLSYYGSMRKDINDRLGSIQTRVSKINPLVNNETLSDLVNRDSLTELSKEYEDQANLLNNTITEYTTVAERKAIREQVKILRSNSEKINLVLNSYTPDLKTFNSLLNFELNNRDASKEDVVGFENATELYNYGADIFELNKDKRNSSEIFDYLSSKEGFDSYFKQEENIENNEVPMSDLLKGTAQPTFIDDEKVKQLLEVGREYEIRDTKKATAPVKIADDRYRVTAPDGTVTFHKTRKEAVEQSQEFTQENTNLSKVRVIALNDDGTVKVEDINGDILNINPKRLKGYKRLETNQEKLLKNKEEIAKEQDEIEHDSGTVATPDPEVIQTQEDTKEEKAKKESKLISAENLFTSSTSESESADYYENGVLVAANVPTHVKNSREFLNNAHTFPNRGNLKSILLTANQVKGLKLDGLVQMSYRKDINSPVEDIPDVMDVNNGWVAQVFVEQDKDGLYFVDKDGQRIGKVGDANIDISKIIFQTMRTTSLTYKNGSPRYRAEQKAEAEAYSRSWAKYRAGLFANEATTFPTFAFTISTGIAKEKRDANNLRETNQVGGILIDEDLISAQEGLITIPIGGTIVNSKGEILKWPSGVPTLKYGDILQMLNNRKFNSREVDGIYETIRQLANNVLEQSKAGQPITLKGPLSNFLQHVLYWKSKADTYGPNQIGIDVNSMTLNLGRNSFPLGEIANNEAAIKTALSSAYNNVNNGTLTKYFSKPFTEFYIDKDGNFTSSVWKNYQTYLLSKSYPSGKARPAGDTPLTTGVSAKTAETPYVFEQKYSTLSGLDLPIEVITPKPEPVVTPTPGVITVGKYKIGKDQENEFEFKAGIVKFTAEGPKEDGTFDVTVKPNEVTKALAANKESLKVVIDALKGAGKFDATIPIGEEENYVLTFMAMQIDATLIKLNKEAPEAPKGKEAAPMAPPEVVAQQDIEANKADNKIKLDKIKSLEDKLSTMSAPISGEFKDYPAEYFQYLNLIFRPEFKGNTSEAFDLYSLKNQIYSGELFDPSFKKVIDSVKNTNQYKGTIDILSKEDKKPPQTPPNEFPSEEYRRVGVNDVVDRMSESDFAIFKEWAAENLPLIPWEELEHMITINPNEKAWGVFVDGVAKFVKGGLRGTEYHEIMEAVWAGMLTADQKQALLDEFKNRKGFFVDRETNQKIPFIEATDQQAKERIMDDFSDFRLGKLPARTLGEYVRRLFNKILNFFKTFNQKPSLKQELFEAINTGKFKERTLSPESITSVPEYSRVAGLTGEQSHSIVQDMLARAGGLLFKVNDKQMLFNSERLSGREMFDKIEQSYIKDGRRQLITDEAWEQLKEKVKSYLKVSGINFNDEEFVDINSENANKNEYVSNPFQDTKASATGALKFSLSTVIERVPTNQENALTLEVPVPKYSDIELKGFPIKGYKLLPFNRVFATLLDKLSNTSNVKMFTKKMLKLAEEDANYVSVFQRMGGKDKVVPFSEFKASDWRYFIQFIQTFSRQKPEAYIQYKSIDGVYTGAANLYTATVQTQKEWLTNIETLAKGDGTIVKWDRSEKVFTVNKDALKAMPIRKAKDMVAMLNAIGVQFDIDTYTKLKGYEKTKFAKQIESIYNHLGDNNELMSLSNKTLDINGPLAALAELYNKVNNPSQESTYFGVEGERIGAFSENNVPSVFENEFNEAESLGELKQARTELNDVFSTNSQILKPGGLFYDENGRKIKDFKVSYIQGEKDEDNDKGTTSSKLTIGDRYTLEINQNLNGNYYILIPGDSATEGMMNIGNNVSYDDVRDGKAWKQVSGIFKGYLLDEVNLALDFKNREKILNVGDKAKQLRFFNEILFDAERDEINQMLEDNRSLSDITEYINSNISNINSAVKYFIENTITETKKQLKNNNKIVVNENSSFSYTDLDSNFAKEAGVNKNALSDKSIDDILTFSNINYVIANIEYHKIIFGDPYQFVVKKDGSLESIKRFKSFFSPRRTTFDSPEYNTFLNTKDGNKVNDIKLEEYKYNPETNTWTGDLGGHNFKDHINTITLKDNVIAGSLTNLSKVYGNTKETDGVSWLRDTSYREIKLKNGQWDLQGPEEEWFQWEMAFTRQHLPGYKYSNTKLEEQDKALMETERPKHTIEVLKPIVTGNKLGKNNFDLILDKFSQMPIFYSMVRGTNLEKLYIQMMKQDIGYAIVQSGRKVGSQELHSIYDGEGKFNEQPFTENTIVQVPWKAYGIQVETTTSGDKYQTRGSQITKMISIDLFDNGVASSPEAAAEYQRNKNLLDLMHENGYKELLINLGIEDLGTSFKMKDGKSVAETLMNEMLRRQVSDNTIDSLKLSSENQFIIPFEASPSYTQIRSIIYSMIDKTIGSPKMSGGAHVQAPVTMLESAVKGRSIVMQNDQGQWEKITREKYATLSDSEKRKVMLTDDSLKFYTREEPWCEIYLPHWFKDKFKGKFSSDKELLRYLNFTADGKKILSGIGFRIPTQLLSTIEVFRVKGFLPQYMGATVIVPSEITTKAGSDFDIDKLNMYLKSVYLDASNEIRVVSLKGNEEQTKEFYTQVYDDTIKKEIEKINYNDEFREDLFLTLSVLEDLNGVLSKKQRIFYKLNQNVINEIISQADEKDLLPSEYMLKQITDMASKEAKLNAKLLNDSLKENFVKDMYKKALENEYYDSLEKLISLPENFDRLISPVDDAGLKDIAIEVNALEGVDDNKIKNRVLDRNYMTKQRGGFLRGKRWVGIAAVNITNLSLKQKNQIYIDNEKIKYAAWEDKKFLGDGKVALKHNITNVNGEDRISLSGTKTADGTNMLISNRLSGYATGAVDITNNDFITRIVKSDLIISTFMFLENIGAGNQGIFFLNQPIITEYLKMLDSKNTKSLFYDNNISLIKSKFPINDDAKESGELNLNDLKTNISKYAEGKFTKNDNLEQRKIFTEFLKYAKMAEFAFEFTQSTNYDTTKFGSGDAFARKQLATDKANSKNIISSAQKVLDNSHIGLQAKLYSNFMSSMGAIFKLEEDKLRIITEDVIKVYSQNKYLGQDNFIKIANKAKMSFLDYIIQTKTGLNNRVEELLVNDKTSVASKLEQAKQTYPNLQILKELQVVPSPRINGAKSIKLRVNDKAAESENMNQDLMRELRDFNEETKSLYDDLISVAILQGSYQSSISLKNIIPIEDYAAIVSPIFDSISTTETLKAFSEGFFERNNFDDPLIVPRIKAVKLKIASEDLVDAPDGSLMVVNTYYSEAFPKIPSLGIKSTDRQVLLLTEKANPKVLNSNFIAMPRVLKLKSGERVDMVTGKTITAADYARRLSKGDLSLSDIFGYKRVLHPSTGKPLRTYDYGGNLQSVYKMVNLYGDGNRASEYYTDFDQSVINNGTIKVQQELNDRDIVSNYPDYYVEVSLSLQTEEEFITPMSNEVIESGVKPRIDTSREWKGDLKTRPVYTAEGVNTMRTEAAEPNEHFGNPFSEAGYGNTVKVNSIDEAVKMYKEWLLNNEATTKDYNLDPKEFVKSIIKSAGGKPTSKGMFAIDGQYYYIPNINIMSKPYGYDAFIQVGNDELYLGSSYKGYTDFVSNKEYALSDLNYEQHQWILDQINQGKLDGATLLYAGKLEARGQGMHPTALAEAVEELRTIKQDEFTQKEQLQFEIEEIKQRIEDLKSIQGELNDTNTENIVVNNLPRITPESAKKETGAKAGNTKDISTSLLSKTGVTVDQAANDIWGDNFVDTGIDTQDVRNIIIDILSSGSKANYISQLGTSSEMQQLKDKLRDLNYQLSAENNVSSETLTLKDGKDYNKSDINSNMLEALGYTPKEIGKILKSIC